jgi:hypothetical protein
MNVHLVLALLGGAALIWNFVSPFFRGYFYGAAVRQHILSMLGRNIMLEMQMENYSHLCARMTEARKAGVAPRVFADQLISAYIRATQG